MGVVHLARRPGGERVALKVLRPHIVGDDEARARLAREVGSLRRIRSQWVAEIVDADPWGPIPYVATRYVPGLSLHDQIQEEGRSPVPTSTWFAPAWPRASPRARVRRAAPRREAVERADGGPHADPHRLRAGPRRRRPEAHPHRLAARHARATCRPRSCTATTRPPPPTCTRGRRPSRTPASAGRRSAAARRWRSWTGSGAGSTTSTGLPDALRAAPRRGASTPSPRGGPTLDADPARPLRPRPGPAHPGRRAGRRGARGPFTVPLAIAAQAGRAPGSTRTPAPRCARPRSSPRPAGRGSSPREPRAGAAARPAGLLGRRLARPPTPGAAGLGRPAAAAAGLPGRARPAGARCSGGRHDRRRGRAAYPYARHAPSSCWSPGCCAAARWRPARPATASGCAGPRSGTTRVVAPLSAPWHLVRSIPATLLLFVWAGGFAAAAALLCYAFAVGVGAERCSSAASCWPSPCASAPAARGCARPLVAAGHPARRTHAGVGAGARWPCCSRRSSSGLLAEAGSHWAARGRSTRILRSRRP